MRQGQRLEQDTGAERGVGRQIRAGYVAGGELCEEAGCCGVVVDGQCTFLLSVMGVSACWVWGGLGSP